MYNIKVAAERSGVTVPVLRAWERRYGIVRPERTASGYRLFDDATIARIRTMRRLVDQGWSPSAAAAAIVAGTVAVMPDTAPSDAPDGVDVPPRAAVGAAEAAHRDGGPAEAAALIARFIDAARTLDPASLGAVLDDVFARGSFERVATDLLFPALERLGDAWAAGTVSVAGEHVATAAVHRRLGQALEAAATHEARGGRIVVGLPPGGRHELGALAFAVAVRRAGLPATYVGANMPVDDWLTAARGAAAVAIGVTTRRDRTRALPLARQLRMSDPNLVVALGGREATAEPGILRLPPRLVESVAALEAAITAVAPA
jgi:hypothetical protein